MLVPANKYNNKQVDPYTRRVLVKIVQYSTSSLYMKWGTDEK